jgi:barstar (barnase inhibitor)
VNPSLPAELPPEVLEIADRHQVFILKARDAQSSDSTVENWRTNRLVRVVRGDRMSTTGGMHEEFAAAFQFPLYYGANMDAFVDSLSQPVEVPVVDARVCLVANAEYFMSLEPEQLWIVADCLAAVREEWAMNRGGPEGRTPLPFSVVLAPDGRFEDVREAWRSAGAVPRLLN